MDVGIDRPGFSPAFEVGLAGLVVVIAASDGGAVDAIDIVVRDHLDHSVRVGTKVLEIVFGARLSIDLSLNELWL